MFIGEWVRCNGQAPQSAKSFHGPRPALLPFSLCIKRPLGWRHHLLPMIQIQLAVSTTNNATLLATFICGQMVIASHTTPATERHVRLASFDVTIYASHTIYIYIYACN